MKNNSVNDLRVLLLYAALALAATYPLALNFSTHLAGGETDAPVFAWNLWWVKYSLFNIRVNPFTTDYLFYPLGINLASAHALTLLNALVALPLQMLFNLPVANNALVLFALTASAYGMYLLARDRLRRAGLDARAAFFAGALYGFGSYHLNYVALGQPNFVGAQWIPFYVLHLLRAQESARGGRNAAWAGVFFVLTVWTDLTYAGFLALLTLAYWLYDTARARRFDARAFALNFTALGAVALVGSAPMLVDFWLDLQRDGDYWTPLVARAPAVSADLLGFILPAAMKPFFDGLTQNFSLQTLNYTFVGIAPLALMLWACAQFRAARAWGWLAVGSAVLMLGPVLQIAGDATNIPLPFQFVQQIPILKSNRFPVRLNVFMMLGVAVAASFALAELLRRARAARAWRAGALALIAFGAFEQIAAPLPLTDARPPAVLEQFANDPGDFTILELPLGWRNSIATQGKPDARAQFLQTFHQKRLISGNASRHPLFKFQYYNELPILNSILALENGEAIDDVRRELDRQAALEVLRFFNIHHVLVHRPLTEPKVEAYVKQIFPLKQVFQDSEWTLYRVTTALPLQGTVEARNEIARMNFDDGWGRAQIAPDHLDYRWSSAGEARVWLPLTRRDYRVSFLLQTPRADQRVNVRINGHALDPLVGQDTWNAYSLHVPSIFLRNGLNEIIFSTDLTPLDAARLDDYRVGATDVMAPVDIAVTGAGFRAGRFGEIFVAGRNVIESRRGYHLVALDPRDGSVQRVGAFDTFANADESRRLAEFVNALPRGVIVAGAAIDEVSRHLTGEAVDALKQLGVDADLRFAFREGHAFIGVKGAHAAHAVEVVDGRFPANVWVGKNVRAPRVSLALGPLFFEELK